MGDVEFELVIRSTRTIVKVNDYQLSIEQCEHKHRYLEIDHHLDARYFVYDSTCSLHQTFFDLAESSHG